MLIAILIGNNIVNIAAASLATLISLQIATVIHYDQGTIITISTIIVTILVLLFGERIPLTDLPPMKDQKQRTAFFKQELFDYANPLLQRFASELGFPPIPLTIKKVQSKRGSCTYDNRIMLNLSLVHLPTRLTQYVVAHEACHLLAKHHQPSFRALVAKFCPHYKALRKELKNQIFIS